MKIAILGAGAFGTALGGVLADNGYDIDYYDVYKEKERLSDAVKEAKFILLSVPSVVTPHMLPH
ncbi:glycerol-3-phosphate dehydrogenase, partial [Candidatus Saccharibacteria bacterium]|nr:glycerol-3-phosphate dehydrogenase [Candidatus Saccharibacteria bacterium]